MSLLCTLLFLLFELRPGVFMMRNEILYIGIIGISSVFFIFASSDFVPEDNYLIDCGSPESTSINGRIFLADSLNSTILSTPQNIYVNTSSNSIPSETYGAVLYHTARVFVEMSQYNFPIKNKGRHYIRLHFFPFVGDKFNLSTARFSVSAQNFTLLKDFQSKSDPEIREYSLNITASNLTLIFIPSSDSFAYLNALEVFSIPDELIPIEVKAVGSQTENQNLEALALETTARVNMGNRTVYPQNDTLWRLWLGDYKYLTNANLVVFVFDVKLVNFNYTNGAVDNNIAPLSVYGSGTKLLSSMDPNTIINATWLFNIDPGFSYLVRYHFCNIIHSVPKNFFFNVFLNSGFAAKDLDLSLVGTPYYMDVFMKPNGNNQLSISVGPSSVLSGYPDAILNGLEIMKISNSKDSLDLADAENPSSRTSKKWSKSKLLMIIVLGIVVSFVILVATIFLFRKQLRQKRIVHSTIQEHKNIVLDGSESAIISRSKIGYRFPFIAVQEATDNFNESRVIGVGGFGKVYNGVLKDDTKVAVKRGGGDGDHQSNQGVNEFKTEIEFISRFRHRHLVSLIGYCDEKREMIIIYEYMENGSLKDHLYGFKNPKNLILNWSKRLEILIGAAKGLHYLHTGSENSIIHRDVKSANILLDESLMAKVADFGISKIGPAIDQTHVSTAVKGSFGYLDPEYLTTQRLTEKSDVYSFGVVMLEILSGRPVIDPSKSRELSNLVEFAMECIKRGEIEEIIDTNIVSEIKIESLVKYKDIVEKCLALQGVDRPTMGDVLWNLECAFRVQVQVQVQDQDQVSRIRINEPEISDSISSINVTNTRFSLDFGNLADVSLSKVFSEMVKGENVGHDM